MKKVLAYIGLILGSLVMYLSTSRTMMAKIAEKRESSKWTWLAPHSVSNAGDLARIAYLDRIKKFQDTVKEVYPNPGRGEKKIDLYMWFDSYVKDIPESAYYGLNSFHHGRRDYYDLEYNLDTSKINILIITLGERFVHSYFYNTDMLNHVRKAPQAAALIPILPAGPMQNNMAALPTIPVDSLFNPNINQNLEYNLFTYNFMSWLRNIKAEINYKFFHRASGDVIISDDKNYLFLKETVVPDGFSSSYLPITEDEVSYLLSQINILYDKYKSDGFDEIYLSIIPNTASMVQPRNYNNLVPMIDNPELRGYESKMPIIDVYADISKNPDYYYRTGDTHWNSHGKNLWLDKINAMLKKWETGEYQRSDATDRTLW